MFKTMTSALDLKKNPKSEEIEKISSFIFCRWLSGNPHTIIAANTINAYSNIPIQNQYAMIKNAFAGKVRFIPYPKNVSEKSIKQIDYLVDFFKISKDKAKEYLELISDEQLREITEMYEAKNVK